jgi:hypothetical protein
MDELQAAWQEQVTIEEDRRRERILWIWTWVGAGLFLVAILWWTILSFTQV